MIFQHRDGELRIYSGSTIGAKATSAVYAEMLFVNAGFNAPIARTRPSETLVMDRGVYTTNAEYRQGMDEEKLAPLPLSFEFKCIDDVTTQYLIRMLSGTSKCEINGKNLRSSKGESMIDGVSTPQFADTSKQAWDIETLWDGTGTSLGFRWREVFFPGDQLNVTEGEDEVVISVAGLVYGDVTRITGFGSGITLNSIYQPQ